MVREPAVAGQFYAGTKEALLEQIKECFASDLGPGLPDASVRKSRRVVGAISPHAGYMFSGPAAAHVYKRIAESEKPDVFLLLGTNHTGFGVTSVWLEDFSTPMGVAKVNKEFGKALIENCGIENNERAHLYEHSIEVQLPFLQFIYRNDFSFVPLVVSSLTKLDELAGGIEKACDETGKKTCIIASSDFTHYGVNYGYAPFYDDVKENISKLDHEAINLIKDLDATGFLEFVKRTGATICGFMPIALLIKSVENTGARASLLKYYTSGEITGDCSTSVSYAAIVFETRNNK